LSTTRQAGPAGGSSYWGTRNRQLPADSAWLDAALKLAAQHRQAHAAADLGSNPNSVQRQSNSSRAYPRIGLWPQWHWL